MAGELITYFAQLGRQWMTDRSSRARLERNRLTKFRRLVQHAYDLSDHYRALIDNRGIDPAHCTIGQFPVLTKSEMMANFDAIVTDHQITRAGVAEFLKWSRDPHNFFLGRYRVLHTSGSSGSRGTFVFSPDDWARGIAAGGRRRVFGGFGTEYRKLAFYGATDGHFAGASMFIWPANGSFSGLFEELICEINAPISDTIDRLNVFQPDLLGGYPSALKALAHASRSARLNIRPKKIHASGEPLTREDQKYLSDVFGCPVLNVYASTETLVMGAARYRDPGMTLFDDNLILEFGEDHLLVTNLFNFTMPLIRYRLDDSVVPLDVESPFGPYPMISHIVGRDEKLLRFRNAMGEDDYLSSHGVNQIFVPGVWRFQLRRRNESAFEFAICLDPVLNADGRKTARDAIVSRIGDLLHKKQLANVDFNVVIEDDIPVDPATGKFRMMADAAG